MVPEAADAQIDLAQPVEEQQTGLDDRAFELPPDELQRAERADFEQPAAFRTPFQQGTPLVRRDRRRRRLRDQDALDDRAELVEPALQGPGVALADLREGGDRPADIGPPLQRAAVAGQHGDVQLRFDHPGAVALQVEIPVPGHGVDGAQEEGVGIVDQPRMKRILCCSEAAAGLAPALDRQGLQPGARQIGLQDQAVMARPQDDGVAGFVHRRAPAAAGCRSGPPPGAMAITRRPTCGRSSAS